MQKSELNQFNALRKRLMKAVANENNNAYRAANKNMRMYMLALSKKYIGNTGGNLYNIGARISKEKAARRVSAARKIQRAWRARKRS